MKLPKVKAVLFKSKTHKDGSHPIMIRITHQRKVIYKGTGHSVTPDAWDEDNSLVYEKKPTVTKRQEGQLNSEKLRELKTRYANAIVLSNAKHINSAIVDAISEINAINQKLKINEESLDLKNIRKKLNPDPTSNKRVSFLAFGRDKQERLLKSGAINTYKRYKTIIDKLAAYRKGKEVLFKEIDAEFLQDYETYLLAKGFEITAKDGSQKLHKSYRVNTIHNNLKTLRAIYYSAIKEGVIPGENNPFFIFKLKQETKTKKVKLTVDEILAIEALPLEPNTLIWHTRNYFLFSFYCAGIRVSDLIQLKWENVTPQGRIEYKMDKTGGFKSVVLLPKAKEILNHYKVGRDSSTRYIFPILDTDYDLNKATVLQSQLSAKTSLINKYLKKIGEMAEIRKPLSSHIARHSFSDIARKRGANIYDISKMLGHSSIKITEAYLASLDLESQDETHKSVLDF